MPLIDSLFLIVFMGMGTVLTVLGLRQVWQDIYVWQISRPKQNAEELAAFKGVKQYPNSFSM